MDQKPIRLLWKGTSMKNIMMLSFLIITNFALGNDETWNKRQGFYEATVIEVGKIEQLPHRTRATVTLDSEIPRSNSGSFVIENEDENLILLYTQPIAEAKEGDPTRKMLINSDGKLDLKSLKGKKGHFYTENHPPEIWYRQQQGK
jgi:hypothetical protein